MRKYLFVAVIFTIFLSGCAAKVVSKVDENTPGKIVLTDQPQEAVFWLGNSWVGGMGSYPILRDGRRGQVQFNGLPVFLNNDDAKKIMADRFPNCSVGTPLIIMSANITLEELTKTNFSIEPDENGKQPKQSFYSAKINKLNDLLIQVEECKD